MYQEYGVWWIGVAGLRVGLGCWSPALKCQHALTHSIFQLPVALADTCEEPRDATAHTNNGGLDGPKTKRGRK